INWSVDCAQAPLETNSAPIAIANQSFFIAYPCFEILSSHVPSAKNAAVNNRLSVTEWECLLEKTP
ncbi:MAG: hypothetical protein JSW48_17570, partial [Betaproteobacteria bacterium]